MEIIQQTLEVERIVNLIAAFGWKVKKRMLMEIQLSLLSKKPFPRVSLLSPSRNCFFLPLRLPLIF